MSAEENKAIVCQWIATVAEAIKSPDHPHHDFWVSFPDLEGTVETQIAEGDTVASRITWRGTHRGEWLGIPPTGRQISFGSIQLDRIADGEVVDHDSQSDWLGVVEQLGGQIVTGNRRQENRELIRHSDDEIYNKQNLEAFDEWFALPDNEEYKRFLAQYFAAFPDNHCAVEKLVAEGDLVASLITMRATHQGEWMGIPATGKKVQYEGFAIDRIVDGKRVEHSGLGNFLGVAEQIGAVLQPGKEER